LLSSTSWTADEDFSLLTKALINLDRSLIKRRADGRSASRTRIVVVITGKGPMKDAFLQNWEQTQRAQGGR
jgi:beta-1,4-mannosyltransferase